MRKHSHKYCTYTHSINNIVFYVGCGTYNRPYTKGRKGKDRNIKWFNIVENHNLKYDINIIFESDNRDECLNKEIELTKYYKSISQAEANDSIGNYLSEHHKQEIQQRAKLRTGNLNPFYGCKHTTETIDKIRKCNIGKKYSKEINKKKANKGIKNPSHNPVVAIFNDGKIKYYDLIKDLQNDLGCLNTSAYARGKLGTPIHYWKTGNCYIYYQKEFNDEIYMVIKQRIDHN